MTKTVNINIERIKSRIEKGGHGVPEEKIISRYYKSINNLKKLIELSDICNVYDNSNSAIERIFKKRKSEFFYNETRLWNKDEIRELTGIEDMVEKNLNNYL